MVTPQNLLETPFLETFFKVPERTFVTVLIHSWNFPERTLKHIWNFILNPIKTGGGAENDIDEELEPTKARPIHLKPIITDIDFTDF